LPEFSQTPSAAFDGEVCIASGPLADVALAVKRALAARPEGSFLTFDDATGRVIDLDLRGSDDDVIARLRLRDREDARAAPAPAHKSGRGRPKLGVVAREVTLLPRHWEWLGKQPGGASQALRRLVDAARGTGDGGAEKRDAQEAAYRFMSAMAGNLPMFEEASRALFAGRRENFERQIAGWPRDIRTYLSKLAGPVFATTDPGRAT